MMHMKNVVNVNHVSRSKSLLMNIIQLHRNEYSDTHAIFIGNKQRVMRAEMCEGSPLCIKPHSAKSISVYEVSEFGGRSRQEQERETMRLHCRSASKDPIRNAPLSFQ